MTRIGFATLPALICLAWCAALPALSQERAGTILTIYTDNLGIVREVRNFSLEPGVNELRLADLPAQLDPTSARLASIWPAKSLVVAEQNFSYDLMSDARLLERFLFKMLILCCRE